MASLITATGLSRGKHREKTKDPSRIRYQSPVLSRSVFHPLYSRHRRGPPYERGMNIHALAPLSCSPSDVSGDQLTKADAWQRSPGGKGWVFWNFQRFSIFHFISFLSSVVQQCWPKECLIVKSVSTLKGPENRPGIPIRCIKFNIHLPLYTLVS